MTSLSSCGWTIELGAIMAALVALPKQGHRSTLTGKSKFQPVKVYPVGD